MFSKEQHSHCDLNQAIDFGKGFQNFLFVCFSLPSYCGFFVVVVLVFLWWRGDLLLLHAPSPFLLLPALMWSGCFPQGLVLTGNMHWLKLFPWLTHNTVISAWTKDSALSYLLLSTRHSKRSAWHKQTTVGSFVSYSSCIAGRDSLKDTKINGAILQQLFGVSMWVLLAVLKFTGFCKHNQVLFP